MQSAAVADLVLTVADAPISSDAIADESSLANFVSQVLVITSDTDWLSAQLLVNLTAGTSYGLYAGLWLAPGASKKKNIIPPRKVSGTGRTGNCNPWWSPICAQPFLRSP